MMRLLLLFALLLHLHPVRLPTVAEACTAVVVGRLATTDGSTYAASSADCSTCDFRLAKVPSRTFKRGAKRPVYLYNGDYPHVVSSRSPTWSANNLEGSRKQLDAWLPTTKPIGYIPQVQRTNALFEGGAGYALLNEHGVSIGETTCPAKFVAKPKGYGGHALLDVAELSQLGLERASTARGAIQIMGELAEKYGYYGSDFDRDTRYIEAGESLMVADREEAWMFHVLPDDTGRGAIWAAQRVPDTDIAVAANVFMIRKIYPNDNETFIFSGNIYDIAKRHGLWNPERDGPQLDFSKAFTKSQVPSRSSYVTGRTWRIFTLANPDLLGNLDPHANELLDGYPFSVTPKAKLSRDDLFRIYRDHYEGTQFDLTKSDAGGPFGDPDRYDAAPVGNMSYERALEGEFGRAISIMRTSYTSIIRSRANLPKEVGSMMYYSQQAPSSSVFVPLYIGIDEIPKPFTRGSLFRHSKESTFWAVALVSNWVHRYYNRADKDLQKAQKSLEDYDVVSMDDFASKLISNGQASSAQIALQKFSTGIAEKAHSEYGALFWRLVARFHDGYIMDEEDAPKVNLKSMFYPKWWLRRVGYFSALETGGSYGRVSQPDIPNQRMAHLYSAVQPEADWTALSFISGLIMGAVSCLAAVTMSSRFLKGAQVMGYQPIR